MWNLLKLTRLKVQQNLVQLCANAVCANKVCRNPLMWKIFPKSLMFRYAIKLRFDLDTKQNVLKQSNDIHTILVTHVIQHIIIHFTLCRIPHHCTYVWITNKPPLKRNKVGLYNIKYTPHNVVNTTSLIKL